MANQSLSTNPIALAIRHDRRIGAERRTVDARDLHAKLQVGRDFSTWIKSRIERYDFVLGVDFEVFPGSGENSTHTEIIGDLSSPDLGNAKPVGRPTIDYALTTTMAKELAMVEESDIGRAVRRYFIAAEQRMRELEAEIGRARSYSTHAAKIRVVEAVRREAGDEAATRAWNAAGLPNLGCLGSQHDHKEQPIDIVKRRLQEYVEREKR